ncbi:hypothetical protein NSQ77_07225 [Oceanobacillus sp. FSL K6-2867]|uniref:hypothetical protein n=1 Tax=Oceanobacillus sp. FSL K6-2867 TaxID=2954748 RepID=UPI0030DB06B4
MNEKDKQVIENYQSDEKMMILIYAQWCINNELDPVKLYEKAYPGQLKNNALLEVIEGTVTAEESAEITDQTVLDVLQLFGNDDLAFIVQEQIEKRDN